MIENRRSNKIDRVLLGAVIILLLMGMLMVFSASSFRGAEKYGDSAIFLKLHIYRIVIGFVFLFVVSKINYKQFRWMVPVLFLLFLGLLVFVLFEPPFNDSRRSMLILGKRFQPSEFMKLVMVLYLSAVFAKGVKSNAFKGKKLYVHYAIFLMVVGIVFIEPDLGTALVIFFVGISMFYISGISWRELGKMAFAVLPLVLIGFFLYPYQKKRIVDFFRFIMGSAPMSYQVKQSVIGLAHGGFTGVGYGCGKQKLFFLPEPFSDFILASLGEELGFLGILVVFGLLIVILWRGIRIALNAPDRYGYLLAGGITVIILINTLMNAGVVVNLLPTTGLPFPFLSFGGSSMFVNLVGVGILLNISKQCCVIDRETHSQSRILREEED